MTKGSPTVANCLLEATRWLPYHEAHLLTAQALALDVDRLTIDESIVVDDVSYQNFLNVLNRRCQGEPLAYVLGERGFWSLNLRVVPDVLIPRTDTEILVEAILPYVDAKSSVLDLGTGSGNVGLALAHETNCEVTLVDLSCSALSVARQNANAHGIQARFIQSNWFEKISDVFDVIASNPPYLSNRDHHLEEGDLCFEPRLALESGPEGLEALDEIISQAPQFLQRDGVLAVEHGFDQASAVRQMFENSGFKEIQDHNDLNGLPRVMLGFRR